MKFVWKWGWLAGVCAALMASAPVHAETGRVIVKYRSTSNVLAQSSDSGRRAAMSAKTGLNVTLSRGLVGRMHLLKVANISSSDLARRIGALADVEYAVPDERRHIQAVPNDSQYSLQWYLQSTEISAINAQSAWDMTTGSGSVVVAVLDTGILPNHPDLTDKLTRNGSAVYGYDFVSDSNISNDGDGRDADPADPGDWVSATDILQDVFKDCPVTDSTWHGSMVSGIIAAASNNSTGVAGVAWGAKILPVRVLGKCGGYDSDIFAGVLWAAGLPVSGVDRNLYPARIINMSLGGPGNCNQAYQDVIAQLTAAGSLVIAAAGNDSGAVSAPANCPGVLGVVGLRNTGTKVAYSSLGPEAGIAAPGGNCGSGTCQYPFYSTKNSGTTVPETDNYSVTSDHEIGTSYSAPLVAGVAALMRSINSALTPARLIARLKAGASAFPASPGINTCTAVTAASPPVSEECNCTTTTCGAGMLSAPGALSEALRPIASIAAATTASAGATVSLTGSGTAADGHSIASYLWTTSAGYLANANQANASLVTGSAGTVTLSLTVTDDAGRTDTATTSLTVNSDAGSSSSSSSSGSSSGSSSSTSSSSSGGGGGAIDFPTALLLLSLAGLAYVGRRERRRQARISAVPAAWHKPPIKP